jgi:hypothetical protein
MTSHHVLSLEQLRITFVLDEATGTFVCPLPDKLSHAQFLEIMRRQRQICLDWARAQRLE